MASPVSAFGLNNEDLKVFSPEKDTFEKDFETNFYMKNYNDSCKQNKNIKIKLFNQKSN